MSRKTTKMSTFKELDNAIYQWFKQKRVGHPVSEPLISEKA